MGLFDFFRGKKQTNSEAPKAADKEVSKLSDSIHHRASNESRQAALDSLAKLAKSTAANTEGNDEATQKLARIVTALLKRFTFNVDPSATDEDEREMVTQTIISIGAPAVPAICEFCKKAESITQALSVLNSILSEEDFVSETVKLLAEWDTEYERNIDPKIQLIMALGEVKNAQIGPQVQRFLEDVDDRARYQAVVTLFAQDYPEVAGPLAKLLMREETARIQNLIAEGLHNSQWSIPETERQKLAGRLPYSYRIQPNGTVARH